MEFKEELFDAIGEWQRGWRENQVRRVEISKRIEKATQSLPNQFKKVNFLCYRKRFLHKGELVDIVMADEKAEGFTSWTLDRRFAERFKGMFKEDAESAAIFAHMPNNGEVVINIPSLWECPDFVKGAEEFRQRGCNNGKALFHFRENNQHEVILDVPLKGSEIIGLAGSSSPFDDLCEKAGIIDDYERDRVFNSLIEEGIYPGEPMYTNEEGAKRVLSNVIRTMWDKIEKAQNAYNSGQGNSK